MSSFIANALYFFQNLDEKYKFKWADMIFTFLIKSGYKIDFKQVHTLCKEDPETIKKVFLSYCLRLEGEKEQQYKKEIQELESENKKLKTEIKTLKKEKEERQDLVSFDYSPSKDSSKFQPK